MMELYCCGCGGEVDAELVDGSVVYPSSTEFVQSLPFWRCRTCGNFVGCHHKTKDRTKPLGCIPTPEIKKARRHIHDLIDPAWKGKGRKVRSGIYQAISDAVGYEYHTAEIRSVEQAREIYRIARDVLANCGRLPPRGE